MRNDKIMTSALAVLSGAAAALALATGAASAATPHASASFNASNDQLVFRSTGNVDDHLTVTVRGADTPGDPDASRIVWTFSDNHPISTKGKYCSHPSTARTDVVQCYRDYGLSGTTGDLPLRIFLGAGNDGANITSTYTFDDRVYGEAGNDRIRTTSFVGLVDGGTGNDTLLGVRTSVSANEPLRIVGGDGNDTVDYGKSSAGLRVDGGRGNDSISTGRGADRIYGNSGNDRVTAGPGNDYVSGASGNDTIFGNSGNDRLVGGAGVDTISGGPGRNTITP